MLIEDTASERWCVVGFWSDQIRWPVIVVGCLVGDESSIATGSLSSSDKQFSGYRLGLSTDFDFCPPPFLSLLSLLRTQQQTHQSIPFTWTDKDDAFEMSCSNLWNQQAAAADIR